MFRIFLFSTDQLQKRYFFALKMLFSDSLWQYYITLTVIHVATVVVVVVTVRMCSDPAAGTKEIQQH